LGNYNGDILAEPLAGAGHYKRLAALRLPPLTTLSPA
jgi:hypothetical protein